MPDPVADILRTVQTSDRLRAAAWDAAYSSDDPNEVADRLRAVPIGDSARARLWDARFTDASAQEPPPEPEQPGMMSRAAETVADVAIGAGKGALNTVGGLGQMARKIPGVSSLDRLMTPIPINTTPENTAQRIGFGAEQVGEFFVPIAGVAGKAARAADIAKSGVLTMAQGGSPAAAGTSAALTAATPALVKAGGKAASAISGRLGRSAEKTMTQALGATKEWAKVEASKLAPQMLDRGVRGSRAAMLKQAKAVTAEVGDRLDDAYRAAAEAGDAVSGTEIRGAIQIARDALKVKSADGARVAVPGTERAVQKFDELDEFVRTLGDDIPVDKAAFIKRTWDRLVSKAGLFGPKATASATDNADAYAIREASGAFRELLNRNPSIESLNKELSFWTGLKTVLKETEKRTQSQRGGLTDAIRGTGGAVAGAMVGGPVGAGVGQLATQQLSKALNSPWFKTTAAGPFKQALANALASGNAERINRAAARMAAAVPSQLTQPAR